MLETNDLSSFNVQCKPPSSYRNKVGSECRGWMQVRRPIGRPAGACERRNDQFLPGCQRFEELETKLNVAQVWGCAWLLCVICGLCNNEAGNNVLVVLT